MAYSPTGYWVIRIWTDAHHDRLCKIHREMAQEQNKTYKAPPRTEVLPIVTWTPGGKAAVFDMDGNLISVDELRNSEIVVTPDDPREGA